MYIYIYICIYVYICIYIYYCRYQVTFQKHVPNFVTNVRIYVFNRWNFGTCLMK